MHIVSWGYKRIEKPQNNCFIGPQVFDNYLEDVYFFLFHIFEDKMCSDFHDFKLVLFPVEFNYGHNIKTRGLSENTPSTHVINLVWLYKRNLFIYFYKVRLNDKNVYSIIKRKIIKYFTCTVCFDNFYVYRKPHNFLGIFYSKIWLYFWVIYIYWIKLENNWINVS